MVEYMLCGSRTQRLGGRTPFHVNRFPNGTAWTEFCRTPEGYLLCFPELAEFEVSADGNQVFGFPAPNVSNATVEHLYLNQVLPLALSKTGKLVVHASAVDVNGSAVAFMADTGRGKSTLAAAFATAGHRFLSDDSLVVETDGTECFVLPSHPSIRLWQDSQQHLLSEDASTAPAVSFTTKGRFLAGSALTYCNEPRPLRTAYVLGPGEAAGVEIKRLSGADSLIALAKHAFVLDIEDRTRIASHFTSLACLANQIPCFHLDYLRNFENLASVIDAITCHATDLGSR